VEQLISVPEYAERFRSVWQVISKRVQSGEKIYRWFRPVCEEPSNDKDREMMNYIILAMIHDHNRRPQWKRICPESDTWADGRWCWLRVWSDDRNKQYKGIYGDSVQEAETIRTEIQLALERVQDDLAKLPAETEPGTTTSSKCRVVWTRLKKVLYVIGGIVAFLAALLTCLYYLDLLDQTKDFIYKILPVKFNRLGRNFFRHGLTQIDTVFKSFLCVLCALCG